MDEIDAANEQIEIMTKAALRAALDSRGLSPSNGICRVCSQPIETERLAAVPHAQQCADCAAEEEAERQRTRRVGGGR